MPEVVIRLFLRVCIFVPVLLEVVLIEVLLKFEHAIIVQERWALNVIRHSDRAYHIAAQIGIQKGTFHLILSQVKLLIRHYVTQFIA